MLCRGVYLGEVWVQAILSLLPCSPNRIPQAAFGGAPRLVQLKAAAFQAAAPEWDLLRRWACAAWGTLNQHRVAHPRAPLSLAG